MKTRNNKVGSSRRFFQTVTQQFPVKKSVPNSARLARAPYASSCRCAFYGRKKMSIRFIPLLVGVAMAATAGSAFAFDAMLNAPTAFRTRASHRAAVIEVIPAKTVIDMARCSRGWCEAAYAGRMGYVYTPILISGEPVSPADGDLIEFSDRTSCRRLLTLSASRRPCGGGRRYSFWPSGSAEVSSRRQRPRC